MIPFQTTGRKHCDYFRRARRRRRSGTGNSVCAELPAESVSALSLEVSSTDRRRAIVKSRGSRTSLQLVGERRQVHESALIRRFIVGAGLRRLSDPGGAGAGGRRQITEEPSRAAISNRARYVMAPRPVRGSNGSSAI